MSSLVRSKSRDLIIPANFYVDALSSGINTLETERVEAGVVAEENLFIIISYRWWRRFQKGELRCGKLRRHEGRGAAGAEAGEATTRAAKRGMSAERSCMFAGDC